MNDNDPVEKPKVSDEVKQEPDPAVYEDFLDACRPVEGAVLDWLTRDKGVAPAVIERLGLRVLGREYRSIMNDLFHRFGNDELLAAGLLKRLKDGRLFETFGDVVWRRTDFLVIPYIRAGRPVYLRLQPPCEDAEAEAGRLSRFMRTAAKVPCLYNVDVLTAVPKPHKVLVCLGELDTWYALSAGYAAVGTPDPGSFKGAWAEAFRPFRIPIVDVERAAIMEVDGGLPRAESEAAATLGYSSTVFLALDATPVGEMGTYSIAGYFVDAGLPVPRFAHLPPGTNLRDYLKDRKKT